MNISHIADFKNFIIQIVIMYLIIFLHNYIGYSGIAAFRCPRWWMKVKVRSKVKPQHFNFRDGKSNTVLHFAVEN